MTNFKSVTPCYTGGGQYLCVGQLEDGNYFLSDLNWASVRLLDSPIDLENEDHFYEDYQQPHLIRDLTDEEGVSFCVEMLKWILKNRPEGNYTGMEMKDALAYWGEIEIRIICGETYDSAVENANE